MEPRSSSVAPCSGQRSLGMQALMGFDDSAATGITKPGLGVLGITEVAGHEGGNREQQVWAERGWVCL